MKGRGKTIGTEHGGAEKSGVADKTLTLRGKDLGLGGYTRYSSSNNG